MSEAWSAEKARERYDRAKRYQEQWEDIISAGDRDPDDEAWFRKQGAWEDTREDLDEALARVEALTAENERLRKLLGSAEANLSLLYFRAPNRIRDYVHMDDVSKVIADARKLLYPRKTATPAGQ